MKKIRLNGIKMALAVGVICAGLFAQADNNKTTFRDSMGRIQGSQATDRNGKTTFRDSMGRIQGTSTTDRNGKTTFRDAQGRIQGSKQ